MASRVLVVGSVNVDLYKRMGGSSVRIDGKPCDVASLKGMTLPAKSFIDKPDIAKQGISCKAGSEEELLLTLEGPFEQKTGGKGANAAAAAGQTFACEFICNFGSKSAEENKALLSDLKKYGSVDTSRSNTVEGPTGTAYILLFDDRDNAILLLGGANQSWPAAPLAEQGSQLHEAIMGSCAVMLQREIPEYVNVEVAKAARALGKPVFMDVGGTDAPLDSALLPYVTVVAPNETELRFIAGVDSTETADGKPDMASIRKAVSSLRSKFAAAGNTSVEVLLTLGADGSMYFGADWAHDSQEDSEGLLPHETYERAFMLLGSDDGKPKDTTGAGDCFRGSFVAARYGEGRSVAEAMLWAAAAASLSVETEGAMPSMPTRSAIEARQATQKLSNRCGGLKRKTISS